MGAEARLQPEAQGIAQAVGNDSLCWGCWVRLSGEVERNGSRHKVRVKCTAFLPFMGCS